VTAAETGTPVAEAIDRAPAAASDYDDDPSAGA
jgi:hypothetical protein